MNDTAQKIFDANMATKIHFEPSTHGFFYLQAWESKETVPTFKGLRGMALTEDKSLYQGESKVRADVFVFCVHIERNPEFYDPLLIDAWEFYVVPADVIDKTNQKTIRLSRVQKMADSVSFGGLSRAVYGATGNRRHLIEVSFRPPSQC
ncbi:MAG: hypothetical protein HQL77_13225 [Magnetococcales bacterium]|nr:hypothetical protein [Magnetococcales bacterium]